MNVTVIVWLGVGLVIFVLSFLLPKRKEELDEDTKKFAGEQIREILNKEIAGMQPKLDDVVSDTIEESSSQTERALEKLTNEKIMAINEYSDTVIEDINNNHKEVLFLYDMLNDKHVMIRNTVSEVERAMGEVTQTAKDIEISAKEAAKGAKVSEETAKRMTDITNHAERTAQIAAQNVETDVRHIVEDMIRGRVEETMEKTALPMIQEKVDTILEEAALFMEQQPKILVDTKVAETTDRAEDRVEQEDVVNKPEIFLKKPEEVPAQPEEASENEFVEGIAESAPKVIIEGEKEGNPTYYIVEPEKTEPAAIMAEADTEAEAVSASPDTAKKISEMDMAPEEIRELERAVAMEVMQGAQMKQLQEKPLENSVKKAEAVKAEKEESMKSIAEEMQPVETIKKQREKHPEETEKNDAEPNKISAISADSPALDVQGQEKRNNNDRILALHKEGMSDMAIAKELGLGVGEVKLVIDLFKGM